MGGKGGGGSNQTYQQTYTGPEYNTTAADMDRLQAQMKAQSEVASDAYAKGDKPKEAVQAKPKPPRDTAFPQFPDAGRVPKPPNQQVATPLDTATPTGLGDQLVSGLTTGNPYLGQV